MLGNLFLLQVYKQVSTILVGLPKYHPTKLNQLQSFIILSSHIAREDEPGGCACAKFIVVDV
uniref:Ovule protein n=1 Tax=Heterorhabditis bacteriophora TaxID=37862 RepID=A0A1I7XFZ5_HETBA